MIDTVKALITPWFENLKLPRRWRTLLALALMLTATVSGYYSLWGILFLWWIFPAVLHGEFHFVEPINRNSDPILFHCMIALWLLSSFVLILWDIAVLLNLPWATAY